MAALLSSFSARHIPALFIAFTQFFGGLWPIFGNTPSAMLEYGLPAHVANSPEGQMGFLVGSGRTVVIGLLMGMLYSQGRYEDLDVILLQCWLRLNEKYLKGEVATRLPAITGLIQSENLYISADPPLLPFLV
ncbi:hypothetical protein B0T16DRAFT_444671 [Cercophora newfieldiana]|uniref:Uncharacterized protein n=1 Tax=Cercophora newfieldiana TaxID=92897 RepID=A0AA39YB52_9PEZI|nr:hypothetical protein B0T16DRAFT_444671 [Cercophora newfieldiana]